MGETPVQVILMKSDALYAMQQNQPYIYCNKVFTICPHLSNSNREVAAFLRVSVCLSFNLPALADETLLFHYCTISDL